MGSPLDPEFCRRPAPMVAPDLLGMLLRAEGDAGEPVVGRIVEVEAYTGDDPASHSHRGPTDRNRTMFGPPGRLYVYFTYGMHWCANVVCGDEGSGEAVLIRALAPVSGLEQMRARRPRARTDRDLCSGPAKLCQALAIDGSADASDVCGSGRVTVLDDGWRPAAVEASTRIGITRAVDRPWRWLVPDDPNVSRRA